MADKKISALTGAATPLAGTEVLPIVQSGSTVKVSVANLTAGRSVVAASLSLTGNLDVNGQSGFQGSTQPTYRGTNIGAVNINNNSADGTVDFTQGLVFTANSNDTGAWATSGIVATGSDGFRGNLVFGTDNDGTKTNAITERMRITPAGVICINTISPVAGYILDISGSANASGNFVSGGGTTSQAALGNKTLEFYNTGSGDGLIKSSDDSSSFTSIALNKTQVKLYTSNTERVNIGSTGDATISTGNVVIGTTAKGLTTGSSIPLGFGTNNSVADMTLNTSGNLVIGSIDFGSRVSVFTDGVGQFIRVQQINATIMEFRNAQDVGGSITIAAGGATSFNTTSDKRLKHAIVDAPDAANLIDALQVRSFKWKVDDTAQRYGFIAQELLEVAPEAVNVPEDEDKMMGVDHSKLVPMLVKEVQSLRARVAQLEGK
jgi:hypothetical protein